jgi:hypothetical protein
MLSPPHPPTHPQVIMGLRRRGAMGANKALQPPPHPGGQLTTKSSSSPRRRQQSEQRGFFFFSSSSLLLLPLPALVMVAAVAVGVCLGLAHKHQGLDLADTLVDLLRGRAGPTPSIGVVGGSKGAAAQQPANPGSRGRGKAKGLAGPITVQIHANGESQPVGNLTLRPEEHRRMQDLRAAAGSLVAACAEEDCRVFTQFGYEAKSLSALRDGDRLFLVPPYRHFVWPTFFVGHRVEVPGVASAYAGKPITLETLSESPRVFEVENFFSEQDAEDLIEFTLGIDDEVYGLKRSTTGAKGSEVGGWVGGEPGVGGGFDLRVALLD